MSKERIRATILPAVNEALRREIEPEHKKYAQWGRGMYGRRLEPLPLRKRLAARLTVILVLKEIALELTREAMADKEAIAAAREDRDWNVGTQAVVCGAEGPLPADVPRQRT